MGSRDQCSGVLLDHLKKQDRKTDKPNSVDKQQDQSTNSSQLQDKLGSPDKQNDQTANQRLVNNPDQSNGPDVLNNTDQCSLFRQSQPLSQEEAVAITELEHVYVFANQGKSIHTHLWSVEDLVDSNRQLQELDPDITTALDQYEVGEGIVEGLCGQAVFLWLDD